jgi:hypothetical protein
MGRQRAGQGARRGPVIPGAADFPRAAIPLGESTIPTLMNRREFVSTAVAASTLLATSSALGTGVEAVPRQARGSEFYELRRYRLRRGPRQQVVDDYWRLAAIPAFHRAGAGPIGVFTVLIGPESPSLYVLIVHRTLEAFSATAARLASDAEYQKAGAPYLDAVAGDPAFVRVDISLMRSFDGMPTLALPFGGGDNGKRARIFELRTYESHSEKAGLAKINMFNTGEIAIFRKAGLQPVFFGETMVGANMPNLTYLLVYEDMAAHDKQWAAFRADPDWRTLSTTPGLTDPDIVMSITNLYLRPAVYSEI